MPVPEIKTILVGIGGVGGKIVTQATESLTAADRRFIAAVCLDTDAKALEELKTAGITYIQTSERTTPAEYCKQHSETDEWYPMNPFLAKQSLDRGAGQVRATSRLAFEASARTPNKLSKFTDALNGISLNSGKDVDSGIRVIVVSSLAGGTGSGLVVQLPFYLRYLLKQYNFDNVRIRGLFLGAEIFEESQGDKYKKQTVISNAYACVKELNGLYAMQKVPCSEVPIKLDYYNPGYMEKLPDGRLSPEHNDIPYDLAYLIEKRNNYGNGLETPSDYINLAAQMIRVLFFTNVGQQVISNEDNILEMLADTGGMARFCGVGYSKAIYPYNEINEYCSLRWMKDCVNSSWLMFDKNFEVERERRERERALDPTLTPLVLSEEYVRMYLDSVKSKSSSRFAVLMRDSFNLDPSDDTFDGDDKAESFAKAVDKFIQHSIATDSLKKQSAKCRPDMESLMHRDEATIKMHELYSAGEKYVEMIPKAAVKHLSSTVQAIIPSLYDGLSDAKEDYSLPVLLKCVHPLSARYLLYRLRGLFETKHLKCVHAREHAKLDMLKNWDAIPDNSNEHDRAIDAVNSREYKNKQRYAEFIQRFASQAEDQANEYDLYRYNYCAAKVYSELLDRIDILIVIYEQFFKSIPIILDVKDKKIETLEKMHNSERQVEYSYVFGTAEIKQMLYKRIRSSLGATNDIQIEDKIKENLFRQLFEHYCKELSIDTSDDDARKRMEADRIAATKKIFDSCIYKGMLNSVKQRGQKVLDIGILEALKSEVELSWDEEQHMDEYGNINPATKEDIRPRLVEIATRAIPFISYNSENAAGGNIYWGVNTELLDRDPAHIEDKSRYDIAATQAIFAIPGEASEALADLELSRNELICYRTIYGLTAEDLKTYSVDSNGYTAYNSRVSAINRWESSQGRRGSGFVSEDKERIHPHIDKHWHLPAYIPSIYSDVAKKDVKKHNRAFFLSIALEMCYLTEMDGDTVWRFRTPDPITGRFKRTDVLRDGKRILPTFYDLFLSMPYNTTIVENVMLTAQTEIDYQFTHRSPETIERDIYDHDIILSLIGKPDPKISESEGIKPVNIFDVLLNVFLLSQHNRYLLENLLNELSEFVTEYCKRMTDSQTSMKRTYLGIMSEIYKNSSIPTSTISNDDKLSFEDITLSPANI